MATQVGGYVCRRVRDLALLRQVIVVSTSIDPVSTIVTAQLSVHGTSLANLEPERRSETGAMSRAEPQGWDMGSHVDPRGIGQASHVCKRAEGLELASTCITSLPSRPPAESRAGLPRYQTPEVIPYGFTEPCLQRHRSHDGA